MIKIFHEAPKSIFGLVQSYTDGDYALCNLLENDEDYTQLFLDARKAGREIILDNAAFELGQPVENALLMQWVEILEPAWLVLPDVINEAYRTINAINCFLSTYGENLPATTKTIGVVHGHSYPQAKYCYQEIEPMVDMVAFSFMPDWWVHPGANTQIQARLYALERINFLNRLEQDGVINFTKPHHLLGCSLPTEFRAQRREWIYSLDTSNPVIWGLNYGKYPPGGPVVKPEGKLFERIDAIPTSTEAKAILANIQHVRKWVNPDAETD